MMWNDTWKATTMLALCLVTVGCGGGGSGGGGGATRDGTLIDSVVEGIDFASGKLSGMTDGQGAFQYKGGKNVTFSIGDIELPSAKGQVVMTPVQLVKGASDQTDPTVTNIARFMQTMDDDNNPNNGILITQAVRTLAVGMSMNFNQSIADFENDANVQNVVSMLTGVTAAGQRALVSAAAAQNHLESTILGQFSGSYAGTFKGDDTGTWEVTVDATGNITGSGFSVSDGPFGISGTVTSSGDSTIAAGDVTTGSTFQGVLKLDGTFSGTWASQSFGDTGTFTGAKT